jgi:hypothetical protein
LPERQVTERRPAGFQRRRRRKDACGRSDRADEPQTKPWCRSQSPKSSEPVSFAFRKPGQRSQPDRLGKLTHGQALHHARPVNFDGTLADAKVVCDDLVRMSLRQRIQNLSRGRMIRNRALVVLGRSGISQTLSPAGAGGQSRAHLVQSEMKEAANRAALMPHSLFALL